MDGDNMAGNPLDELKRLDAEVDRVRDLADLKPIYYRLDELSKANAGDFEIQLVVADIKQHLVNHGMKLKEGAGGPTGSFAPPPPPGPPNIPSTATPPPRSGPPSLGPTSPFGAGPAESIPTSNMPALPHVPPSMTGTGSGPSGPPSMMGGPPSYPPPGPPPFQGGGDYGQPPPDQPSQQGKGGGKGPLNWKRALWMGGLAGAVLSIVAIVVLVQLARKKNGEGPPPGNEVQVEVTTNPPGASIRINNEARCTSNCKIPLAPGNYQVTALLDGFEPAASGVTVAAGSPIAVNLNLEPLSQTLRLLTDLDAGKVAIDDQPAVELQEGQFILDKVPAGAHTVKLTAKGSEATFTFESAPGKAPVLTGPVQTKNLMGVVVSSFGSKAKVTTNAGPWKLALNGQAQGEVSPNGLDLQGFTPGVQEFVVNEGKDQKTMRESFGAAPLITAFFKSDQNVGTLIVATGEDGATVYLNDRAYPRKTQRGQVRMQILGNVKVRVSKDGFQNEPVQTATVKKGEETRLEFKLRPLPQVGAIQLRGAAPGTQVYLDQRNIGAVGPDGSFSYSGVSPGEHNIELRREQFATKRISKSFKAGDTITLAGADVTLAAGVGTLRLVRNPADAAVSWRKAEETQLHEVRGNQIDLAPGAYVFTAKSAGHGDKTDV
ncbi:MAG: PEGA domain-containing protein, partial [Bryobacteraceae bacterium]